MKKLFIIFFQFIVCQIAFSQYEEKWNCEKEDKHEKVDWKTFPLTLCIHMDFQKLSDCIYNHTYTFECVLEIAAGVKRSKDNEAVIKKKVQDFWNKYKLNCTCSATNFLVTNGSILKYAGQSNFKSFFWTIIEIYDLDINFIDPADGKTLLDFLKEQLDKKVNSTPTHPNTLEAKKIFEYLRSKGALYKSELKQ